MTEGPVDPAEVLAALGVGGVRACVPCSGDSGADTWRVERDGPAYALRLLPASWRGTGEREAAVQRAALAGGVPVPQIVAEATFRGRFALVTGWCPGRTVLAELEANPRRVRALGRAFGRAQAAIHAVEAPAVLRRPDRPWQSAGGPGTEAIQARLAALPLRAGALLHGDYHPLNVLTDGEGVTGVIDWTNAAAGDPRADLARTVSILRVAARGRVPERTLAILRAFERGWRAGYEAVAGPIGDLTVFLAWAGAYMIRDLDGRRGPAEQAAIARWAAYWRRRAGV